MKANNFPLLLRLVAMMGFIILLLLNFNQAFASDESPPQEEGGFGRLINKQRPFIFAFGAELNFGQLHPDGSNFKNTLEVYGINPPGLLTNMNLNLEALLRFQDYWEIGVHTAYNNLFSYGSGDTEYHISSKEIGPVLRLVMGKKTIGDEKFFDVALKLETGYLGAQLFYRQKRQTFSTFFVRPSLSLAWSGGLGHEWTIGWTYAQVSPPLSIDQPIPLGGLDIGFLIRFDPSLSF